MSHFVRASKYRHVYVEVPKADDTWSAVPVATTQGEQSYIKGNSKYAAVALQGGGGPFAILPYNKPDKRYQRDMPVIAGHTSAVLDFDFYPFDDSLIASCSDDCTIKGWGIPDGGLTETLTEPLFNMTGHQRKVTLILWHPTAANVLASVSGDLTCKLWDVATQQEINSLNAHDQLIQDIVWDYNGTCYATSCKDKNIRICDARTATVSQMVENAHEGARSAKLTYLGSKNKLLSVGFTRQSQRQFKIWDPRNLSAEIKLMSIDQAAGVILPFYDEDTSLLYLAGKGDGNVRYYECVDENPWCFAVSEYRSTVAAKGMCMIPKRGLNVMGCETARLLKLSTNMVEKLSFVVPRKSDAFQEDLFPPTFSGMPSHTAEQWLNGSDKAPRLMDLNPASVQRTSVTRSAMAGAGAAAAAAKPATPVAVNLAARAKTASQTTAELESALARIALLEKVIRDAKLTVP